MLKNNYVSILGIRLEKYAKNKNETNKFAIVKKLILSQLNIKKKYKLYNVVDKIL